MWVHVIAHRSAIPYPALGLPQSTHLRIGLVRLDKELKATAAKWSALSDGVTIRMTCARLGSTGCWLQRKSAGAAPRNVHRGGPLAGPRATGQLSLGWIEQSKCCDSWHCYSSHMFPLTAETSFVPAKLTAELRLKGSTILKKPTGDPVERRSRGVKRFHHPKIKVISGFFVYQFLPSVFFKM